MKSRTILLLLAGLVAIGATSPAMAVELTVNSGSGTGTYTTGANIPIVANASPLGQSFVFWVGDVGGIANVNAASTNIIMPAGDATITAISIPLVPYSIRLREGGDDIDDRDPAYVNTMVDDISLQFTDKTQDPLNHMPSGGSGAYWMPEMTLQLDEAVNFTDFDQDYGGVAIECFGEMFDLLPPTSGGADLVITHADLVQTSANSQTAKGMELTVYRMLTKWMYHPLGENEYNVYSDVIDTDGDHYNPGGDVEWATSPDGNALFGALTIDNHNSFGALDYDANNGVSIIWITHGTLLGSNSWDVTDMVRTMYDVNDNQGFCFRLTDANYTAPGDGRAIIQWLSSEYMSSIPPRGRPELRIQYAWSNQPGNPVHLTVVSGSGGGWTAEGATVEIVADTAPTGLFFAEWVGDTDIINGSSNRASTSTVTMGASAVTLTATYGPGLILTVLNPSFPPMASRTYEYPQGTIIPINTGAPPELSGKVFAGWTGDIAGVANVWAESTYYLQPDVNTTITATYDWKVVLTVDFGTAGDTMCVEGQPVGIIADVALEGFMFSHWSGDVADVENVLSPSTTVTMPAFDVLVQANYTAETFLTVIDGNSDSRWNEGKYPTGGTATISADIPPTGQVFSAWTGDVGTVANVNARITTLTMNADYTVTATYVLDSIEDTDMVYKTPIRDAELRNNTTGYPTYLDFSYSWTGTARNMYISTSGSSLTHRKGIIEFDISDVSAVDSVKLWVFCLDATMYGSDSSVTVYRGLEQFTEEEMTWYDKATGAAWTTPGGYYDTGISASGSIPGTGWHVIDVTNLYNEAVTAEQDYLSLVITRGVPGSSGEISLATKEHDDGSGAGSNAPRLWIDTVPAAPTYDLTVVSGNGSGNYTSGQVVPITAAAAPTGEIFDAWTGDIGGVGDTGAPSTNYTMGAANASVTATYIPSCVFWPGDLNEDQIIDIVDLNMVLIDWGRSGGAISDPRSDGNGDLTVDIIDLNLVLIDWGKTGCQ